MIILQSTLYNCLPNFYLLTNIFISFHEKASAPVSFVNFGDESTVETDYHRHGMFDASGSADLKHQSN